MLAQDKDKSTEKAKSESKPTPVSIGGEPVVVLQRPPVTDESKPQFLQATILPGRGMAVLQIKAYLPGKGRVRHAQCASATGGGATVEQR